jgi:hypothetical protein
LCRTFSHNLIEVMSTFDFLGGASPLPRYVICHPRLDRGSRGFMTRSRIKPACRQTGAGWHPLLHPKSLCMTRFDTLFLTATLRVWQVFQISRLLRIHILPPLRIGLF